MPTLIFGYGNADRQDDGVAWHVLIDLMRKFGRPIPKDVDDIENEIPDLAFMFHLQLTPELASEISQFDRICFIDAHTGAVPELVHYEELSPSFQNSPFTHHLTPNSLLSIMQATEKSVPESILVSVRGYHFGFTQKLSPETNALVPIASQIIEKWITKE